MEIELLDEKFESYGSGVPRTPSNGCIHLTEVIDSIEEEMGWSYTGKEFGDKGVCMDTGFTFERMMEIAYVYRAGTRIGEIELDGIIGSPDGIGLDDEGNLVLIELKCAWASTKKTPDKRWRYMTQVQSYLKMLGLNTVIMRILHVVGAFWGDGPRYKAYKITFDQIELDDNWTMIIGQRDRMREAA